MNNDAFKLYSGKHVDGSSGCRLAAVAFCDMWWEKGVVGNAGPSVPAAPVPWEGGQDGSDAAPLAKAFCTFLKY